MHYTQLELIDFRSYDRYKVALSPGTNVIVGPNGSGKTNLLEALYVLSSGTSFRGRDKDMLRHESTHLRLKAKLDDHSLRQFDLTLPNDRLQKQFTINHTLRGRLAFNQKIPVTLFDPDILRTLSGSPARRRDYVDDLLARTRPTYGTSLRRYERALAQRNELLKRSLTGDPQWQDHLFVWDITLAELAAQIISARLELMSVFTDRLSDYYSRIANTKTTIAMAYSSTVTPATYQQEMLGHLQRNLKSDRLRGFTSFGPHRDDIVITINDHLAADVASRGEMRSIMLAMKLIEVDMLRAIFDRSPLLLLDDVFSELDAARRLKLTEVMKDTQTIITTTNADIEALPASTSFITL